MPGTFHRLPGSSRCEISSNLIAGTRAPATLDPARYYSGACGRKLRFARVDMAVPPGHKVGEVERAKRQPLDQSHHVVALDLRELIGKSAFVSAINQAQAARAPEDRNLLVLVHGYNTSFDAALFRFTQCVEDMGNRGVPVLFTWPSGGGLLTGRRSPRGLFRARQRARPRFPKA